MSVVFRCDAVEARYKAEALWECLPQSGPSGVKGCPVSRRVGEGASSSGRAQGRSEGFYWRGFASMSGTTARAPWGGSRRRRVGCVLTQTGEGSPVAGGARTVAEATPVVGI